jgi:cellulose synthase/poly-beta-1,6-N-acetylglucosamine synthase-like glycosyltransferase
MNQLDDASQVVPPRVSVCIVTFNQEAYIADCLLSVLAQDVPFEIEILVGDDASTDGTAAVVSQIMDRHPGRVSYFGHERNLGPSGNYQFLIERARGEFIAHLDGDDYWLPGKLRAQVAFMEVHLDCVAAYTNAIVVGSAQNMMGVFSNAQPEVFDETYLLSRGNFLNHSSMIYRANERHRILELQGNFIDYRMHLRLSRAGKLGFLNALLVGYRMYLPQAMTIATPEKVRALYWEAVAEACEHRKLDAPAVSGLGSFLAAAMIQSLARRTPQVWLQWRRHVRQAFPSTVRAVGAASLMQFCRLLIQNLQQRCTRRLGGAALRVYFTR